MSESTSIVSAIISGISAIFKIAQQATQYIAVPNELRHLPLTVKVADSSINTAYRLLRIKVQNLDDDLVKDVERSIADTKSILEILRDTVETCRKDLELRKPAVLKDRASWTTSRNEEFGSKLATLTITLGALNRDITRMEVAWRPGLVSAPIPCAESTADPRRREKTTFRSFPRSPTVRRRLQAEQARSLRNTRVGWQDDHSPRCEPNHMFSPTVSAFSFGSSNTLVEEPWEKRAGETSSPASGSRKHCFELPAGVSLGYNRRRHTFEDTIISPVVESWAMEDAGFANENTMSPLSPLSPSQKPRAPRRRSNLI